MLGLVILEEPQLLFVQVLWLELQQHLAAMH
jgi:hypothetical protein